MARSLLDLTHMRKLSAPTFCVVVALVGFSACRHVGEDPAGDDLHAQRLHSESTHSKVLHAADPHRQQPQISAALATLLAEKQAKGRAAEWTAVLAFYAQRDNAPAWVDDRNVSRAMTALQVLRTAPD